MPKITELFVYPVKGLRPIELKSASVHELGTPYDLSVVGMQCKKQSSSSMACHAYS